MTITTEMLTRNIAKSGEVLNWNGFSPLAVILGFKIKKLENKIYANITLDREREGYKPLHGCSV